MGDSVEGYEDINQKKYSFCIIEDADFNARRIELKKNLKKNLYYIPARLLMIYGFDFYAFK